MKVVLLAAAFAAAAAADGDSWMLTFDGGMVLPQGATRPWILWLHEEPGIFHAAGECPTYHRSLHRIQVFESSEQAGHRRLRIEVQAPSDGYSPEDGAQWRWSMQADLPWRDGARGTWSDAGRRSWLPSASGAARGDVELRRVPAATTARWSIECERTFLEFGAKAQHQRARIEWRVDGGRLREAWVVPPGSLTDTAWGVRVVAWRRQYSSTWLTLAGTRQDGQPIAGELELDGWAFGTRWLGRTVWSPASGALTAGWARGEGRDEESAVGAAHELIVHDALAPGGYLRVFWQDRGGGRYSAFATSPNSSNATHEVEALFAPPGADGWSASELRLRLRPDAWVPVDGRDRSLVLVGWMRRGDGVWRDGRVELRRSDGSTTACAVTADLLPPLDLAGRRRLTLKLEAGPATSSTAARRAWQGRLFVSGTVADGRWIEARLSNNHRPGLRGEVLPGSTCEVDASGILRSGLRLRVAGAGDGIDGEWSISATCAMAAHVGGGTWSRSGGAVADGGTCWVAWAR